MPTDLYPMWGESSAAIAPQMYNFAAMNYGNQNANIARRQAFDQQDIANRQNYFQQQREMEREDANRQLAAQELARREASDQGRIAQGAYQFRATLADSAARLAEEKRLHNLQYGTGSGFENDQTASKIASDLQANKIWDVTPERGATLYNTTPEKFKAIYDQFATLYPDRVFDALSRKLADEKFKLASKFKLATDASSHDWKPLHDQIEAQIPTPLRGEIVLNRMTGKLERASAQPSYFKFPLNAGEMTQDANTTAISSSTRNPYADAAVADIRNNPWLGAIPAVAAYRIGKLAAAPIQNWFDSGGSPVTGGTGTTPAAPTAPVGPAMPPEFEYRNTSGGSIPRLNPNTLTPPQPPPQPPAPAQAAFLPMHDPRGRLVKVPWDQISKYRARGYYE